MLAGTLVRENLAEDREFAVVRLIVAGWTGRDAKAMDAHLTELRKLGVRSPQVVPVFYELDSRLLTNEGVIAVVGDRSSGEAEAVIVFDGARRWVTVGSDHTDRDLETVNVTKSKQACSKPIGKKYWAFDDVAEHWDRLELRSFIGNGQDRVLYQEGALAGNLSPDMLLSEMHRRGMQCGDSSSGIALFCGTQPVIGAIRGGDYFDIELYDPVLQRRIEHHYRVAVLPDVG